MSAISEEVDGELRRRRRPEGLPFRADGRRDKLDGLAGVKQVSHVRSDQGSAGQWQAADRENGHRSGHDRALLPLQVGEGLEQSLATLAAAGDVIVTKGFAGNPST